MTTPATAPTSAQLDAVQKRTLRVLVCVLIFSGAGLAAGITIGALLAQGVLDFTVVITCAVTATTPIAILLLGHRPTANTAARS